MTRYVHYLIATGEIQGDGVAEALEAVTPVPGGAVRASDVGGADTHYVDPDSDDVLAYSQEGAARKRAHPGAGFRWSPADEAWIDERAVERIRADLLAQAKAIRDEKLEGGFEWDASRFDSDAAVSQPRLLGLFTSAALGLVPPEGQPWRLADNSWRVLSASDAQAVWGAFQAHMAGLFAAFAAHEAQVLGTEDIEALRDYDVEANWPATGAAP